MQHHILGHIKYDAGLLPVVGAAVYLRALLAVARQHIQRDGGSKLAVVRGHKRTPRQIAMAGAVHLNAAHFHLFIERINVPEIVKAGARYFSALPLSGKLPFKPRRGLILKGGKAYDVQRLSGRDAIAGGGRFCHGVLHAKAPQQFPHVLGQTFDGGHIGALRPHRADKAVRVHEPLQQRPALFGGSAFILGRDAFLAETGQKDGFERRDSEYPAPAAALFPFAGDLIGKLL